MNTNGHADLAHAARFAELLGLALPHAASVEEALAAVDLALATPEPTPATPVALAHDAFSRKAQGVLNRAVEAVKHISAAARRDLRAALSKKTSGEVGQALVAFIARYRTKLASLLSASQLAALLEGAREVAAKLPDPPVTAAAAPPGLPPEQATRLLERFRGLGEAERERILNLLAPAERRWLEQALAAPPPEPPPAFRVPAPEEPGRVQLPVIEEAVRLLREKRVVTRDLYDRLDAASRQKAFTVAGVTARETLNKVQDALAEVVAEGADLDAFRDKVLAEVEPGTFLSDNHLEVVFRNAVQGAFSDGQYGVWQHPVIKGGFPYVRYAAIDDDRVRPEHLAMERHGIGGGPIYRTEDPVFQAMRPPWSWNCRCGWTLLPVRDAAEQGVDEAKRWLESGTEPQPPAFVDWPPFRPPPGFQRPVMAGSPLSVALALDSLEDFVENEGTGLFAPAMTDVTPPLENRGTGPQPEPPEKRGTRNGRKPRKLARRVRMRKRWRKQDAALALDAEGNWHGPEAPGPGWVQVGTGPQGGKVWRQQRTGQATSPEQVAANVQHYIAQGAQKGRTLNEIRRNTGIPDAQLFPLLQGMLQSGALDDSTTRRGQVAYRVKGTAAPPTPAPPSAQKPAPPQPAPRLLPRQPRNATEAANMLVQEKHSYSHLVPAEEIYQALGVDEGRGREALLEAGRAGQLRLFGFGYGEEGQPQYVEVPKEKFRPFPTVATPEQQAQVRAAAERAFTELLPQSPHGLVPIWQVRERVSSPDKAALDESILDMWREGKVRLVSLADLQKATPAQLDASVPGVNETLFFIEQPRAGLSLEHFGTEPPGPDWRFAGDGRWVKDAD